MEELGARLEDVIRTRVLLTRIEDWQAVAEVRGESLPPELDVRVDLPVPAFLPEEYVPAVDERVLLYRRIAAARTPEGVERALAKFVDFPGAAPAAGSASAAAADTAGSPTALKKGLTLQQVERLLGPAAEASTDKQGSLEIMTRTYVAEEQKIVAKFASGVLVEYAITSN